MKNCLNKEQTVCISVVCSLPLPIHIPIQVYEKRLGWHFLFENVPFPRKMPVKTDVIQIFTFQSKFKEAVSKYEECIKLCPDNVVPYTNRALCYLRLNKVRRLYTANSCQYQYSRDAKPS